MTEPYGPYGTGPASPPPQRKRHHPLRWILGGIGALIALFVVIGVATAGSTPPPRTHNATAATTQPSTAPATPAAASTPPLHVTRVKFVVTGTGAPSITYGSDSDNRDGGGTLGILSDGNTLPWHGSMKFRGDAEFYSIDAQLESGGDITCKIVVTGPGVAPLTVASGHASGGDNICSAQAAPNDTTGSSWQNEG